MVTEKASHSESLATRSSSFLNWKSFWSQITIISNVSEILIKHSTIKGNCGSCYCPLFLRVLCSIFLFCLFLCLGAKERLMCMSQWDIVSLVFVFLFACCVFPSNALRNVRMVFLQLQSRCWKSPLASEQLHTCTAGTSTRWWLLLMHCCDWAAKFHWVGIQGFMYLILSL